jgi:hypothetical protein
MTATLVPSSYAGTIRDAARTNPRKGGGDLGNLAEIMPACAALKCLFDSRKKAKPSSLKSSAGPRPASGGSLNTRRVDATSYGRRIVDWALSSYRLKVSPGSSAGEPSSLKVNLPSPSWATWPTIAPPSFFCKSNNEPSVV